MPGHSTRRLAAIMFTDITGYTALMQENEPARHPSFSRAKTWTSGKSAASSARRISSKAASGKRATGCASPRNWSAAWTATISSRRPTTAPSKTYSPCRTRSPRRSPTAFASTSEKPSTDNYYLQELKTIEEQPDQAVGISFDLAILHTCFGNLDLAFNYLETAFKNQISDALIFRSDPFFAPLRQDARIERMEALLGEMPEIDF
jgi:hypothetical protein